VSYSKADVHVDLSNDGVSEGVKVGEIDAMNSGWMMLCMMLCMISHTQSQDTDNPPLYIYLLIAVGTVFNPRIL
jgi:hypothetical protein